MRSFKSLGIALAFVSLAPASAARQAVGVAQPHGEGAVIVRNGRALPLKTVRPVYSGDRVVTPFRGTAKLLLEQCIAEEAPVSGSVVTRVAPLSSYTVANRCTSEAMGKQPAQVGQEATGAGSPGAGPGAIGAAGSAAGATTATWIMGVVGLVNLGATAAVAADAKPLSP